MAVAFSGQASGTDSATLPTHAAGDLIVCFGYRDGSATLFTVPGGWTTLDHQQGQALAHNGGLFYKIAASSAETSGTWTNASEVLFHVYTGAEVGAWVQNAGTTLTVNFAALAFNVGDGSSWAAGFSGYRQADTTLETPPSGMTNRSNYSNASPSSEASGHDTNGGVTGWSSTNQTLTGSSGGWITYVLELKATGSSAQNITGALVTNSQTFYGATVGRGAVNIAGALTTNAQSFYGATVAASYGIAGGKFDNSQTFYQATVAPGPVGISGALYTNGQTFFGATVSQASGAQDIAAALFTNAQAFFGATVSVGAVDIAAELFTNDNVFFGATVTDGSVPVQQPTTSSGSSTTWSRKTASRIAREAERAKSARKARPIIIRAVGAALGGSDDARAAAAEAVSETLTTAPITQDTVAEVYALAERILALIDDEDAEMLLLTAA